MSETPDLGALRQQMAAQEQAQQMLAAALNATLNTPARIVQVLSNAVVLAPQEDGRMVLLVAQPSGERIDILLSVEAVRALRRALADPSQNGSG